MSTDFATWRGMLPDEDAPTLPGLHGPLRNTPFPRVPAITPPRFESQRARRISGPALVAERRDAGAHTLPLRIVIGALVALAVWVTLAYIPWLVLSAWIAATARPAVQRVAARLGGRERAASLVVFMLLLAMVVPMSLVLATLIQDARGVLSSEQTTGSFGAALGTWIRPTAAAGGFRSWFSEHGRELFSVASDMTSVAAELGSGMFVMVVGIYVFLTEGSRAYGWFLANAPIADRHIERFTEAFHETGRGLLVGIGLTGLLQASVATITYVALGIPRALLLGFATFVASAIPSIGTALVWVPIAVMLGVQGHQTEAIILVVIGAVCISSADNLLRPLLARRAHLDLHPFVVMVSMFGGLAAIGGWGLLLGPLFLRLCVEGLRIARMEQLMPSAT